MAFGWKRLLPFALANGVFTAVLVILFEQGQMQNLLALVRAFFVD
jgi:hypothetical protein